MSEAEASNIHWRGTDEGFKLKDTTGWQGEGNGSNLSGFSAMPGGYRNTGGGFFHNFSQSYFWSITTNGLQIWYRNLNSSNLNVYRKYDNLELGMSARCIKD